MSQHRNKQKAAPVEETDAELYDQGTNPDALNKVVLHVNATGTLNSLATSPEGLVWTISGASVAKRAIFGALSNANGDITDAKYILVADMRVKSVRNTFPLNLALKTPVPCPTKTKNKQGKGYDMLVRSNFESNDERLLIPRDETCETLPFDVSTYPLGEREHNLDMTKVGSQKHYKIKPNHPVRVMQLVDGEEGPNGFVVSEQMYHDAYTRMEKKVKCDHRVIPLDEVVFKFGREDGRQWSDPIESLEGTDAPNLEDQVRRTKYEVSLEVEIRYKLL